MYVRPGGLGEILWILFPVYSYVLRRVSCNGIVVRSFFFVMSGVLGKW